MRIEYVSEGATQILAANRRRIERLQDLRAPLMEATEVVYTGIREWYDSQGEGTWPPLAESTIARKASQGYSSPSRPLYAEGNLYESATSPSGPYSFRTPIGNHSVVLGVDWQKGGWQIPVVLSRGTTTAGRGNRTRIPARRIYPPLGSIAGQAIIKATTDILIAWLRL